MVAVQADANKARPTMATVVEREHFETSVSCGSEQPCASNRFVQMFTESDSLNEYFQLKQGALKMFEKSKIVVPSHLILATFDRTVCTRTTNILAFA